MEERARDRRKAHQALAGAIIISLFAGLNYIWSLTSAGLVSEYGWSSLQASLPYSLFTIMASVLVLFGGKFIDTQPPKRAAFMAGLLLLIGLVSSAFLFEHPWLFCITYGVVMAAGTGTITATAVGSSVKWFPYRKRGIVSGAVYLASGFTAVYMSPICNALIQNFGTSVAMICLGLCGGTVIMIASRLIHTPDPAAMKRLEEEEAETHSDAVTYKVKEYGWRDMIKTSSFWKLFLTFTALCLAGLMVIGNVATIANVQAGWAGGYLMLVLNTSFSCVGRLTGGAIAVKVGIKKFWILICALQLVNMLLFAQYTTIPTLLFGAAIGGYCFGGIFSIAPSTISGEFGKKNSGVNYGVLHLGFACGGLIGPVLAGYFVDTFGGYDYAYLLAACFLVVGLVSAISMKKSIGVPKPDTDNESVQAQASTSVA